MEKQALIERKVYGKIYSIYTLNLALLAKPKFSSSVRQAGAEPNATDSWNYTPLHEAGVKGKTDVCVLLLQHGADPAIRNSEGKTPVDVSDPETKLVLMGE